MVFKRRDKRHIADILREAIWPRGGWSRALQYLKLRLNRLPDSPERIARGVFAGVIVAFTPLFGLHFLAAAVLSWVVRGNLIAALLATFIANPLTLPVIAVLSLRLGNWMLGDVFSPGQVESTGAMFYDAMGDLFHNLWVVFGGGTAHWGGVVRFFDGIFVPYLVGGLIPGLVCAIVGYGLTASIVSAYQNRRRTQLRERIAVARAVIATRKAAAHPAQGE